MVYEWDEKRARRAQRIRMSLSLLVAACVVGVPVCIAAALDIVPAF
ncbi:hypothetical protein [Rhizobium sp. LC145]|jgi:hypothetical protein|nr:hypothetical protein [Rhizobium sp. LC145]